MMQLRPGQAEIIIRATVEENLYIPHVPTLKQAKFLVLMEPEVLWGGAAGGGKSDALLMSALQFVEVPDYSAIIFRRTFTDLSLPKALMDRSHEWLATTGARWDAQKKQWRFPSGAVLAFGYLKHSLDHFRYQGAEFHFIGFDELTQFEEEQYLYLFSRRRRLKDSPIPVRTRAASNPGGIGHDWVYRRFVAPDATRTFIPATLRDNPHIDQEAYIESLGELDPITRAQLLTGDWNAYEAGRFSRDWFKDCWLEGDYWRFSDRDDRVHVSDVWHFLTVDPAASEKQSADYTCIGAFGRPPWPACMVVDVVRKRLPIEAIVPEISIVCGRWNPKFVGIESLAFQAYVVLEAKRTVGMPTVRSLSPTAATKTVPQTMKLARAIPAINWCYRGRVYLLRGASWRREFEDELVHFTGNQKQDAYDDQVDVFAYAVQELNNCDVSPVEQGIDDVRLRPFGRRAGATSHTFLQSDQGRKDNILCHSLRERGKGFGGRFD